MILGQDAGNLTVRDYLTPMGRASPSIRLQTQHGLSEETFNFSGPVWYDRTVRVRTYGKSAGLVLVFAGVAAVTGQ